MEEKKSVAETLRSGQIPPGTCASTAMRCAFGLGRVSGTDCLGMSCGDCRRETRSMIADMIEAEQAVDVSALNLLCDKLEMGGEKSRDIAMQIRAALNGAERSKTEHDGVDVDALLEVAFLIEGTRVELIERADAVANAKGAYVNCIVTMPTAKMQEWADTIRDAVKGANASKSTPLNASKSRELPYCAIWPRFEDGKLADFEDEFQCGEETLRIRGILFEYDGDGVRLYYGDYPNYYSDYKRYDRGQRIKRPEPEVLGADNLPIKVGDTVWHEADGSELTVVGFRDEKEDGEVMVDVEGKWFCVRQFSLTHRKPDTRESLMAEIVEAVKADYAVNLLPLFERYEQLILRDEGARQ